MSLDQSSRLTTSVSSTIIVSHALYLLSTSVLATEIPCPELGKDLLRPLAGRQGEAEGEIGEGGQGLTSTDLERPRPWPQVSYKIIGSGSG